MSRPEPEAQARRPSKPAHLRELESEAIGILRETRAQCRSPVLLYSIGKDSGVLLHLALKAFGGRLPFPALHIDTGWKFREMIRFRDETAARLGLDLRVRTNARAAAQGVDPLTTPAGLYTKVMKTEALREALDAGGFDAAIGGARRDEERSRAKERVFSLRDSRHGWDPRRQRAELWALYEARVRLGESVRVFPLSNWTERDVWTYIEAEGIPVVDLYFARERPVVERGGMLIVRDDERLTLAPGEVVRELRVRFRTLGCYPLTAAIASEATSLGEILAEIAASTASERVGRLIDSDEPAAMERKKREGYF